MFCERCGAKNSDEAVFCQKCGLRFSDEEETRVVRPLKANNTDDSEEKEIFAKV